MFECNEGTKIEASKHCDGIIDCIDGSDENICLEIPPTDLVEKFMCQDGAKIYVDKGGLFSEIIMVFVLLSPNYSLFFLAESVKHIFIEEQILS